MANTTLSDTERLAKLEQAMKLLREVEFSYPKGSTQRDALYHTVAQHFSFLGVVGQLIYALKREIGPF